MIIQHNLLASNANRQYGISVNRRGKSTEKLSTGYKINRSADDTAGLQISEKLRSQIRGLDQASDNASDGISLVQVADAALGELESVVHRIRELSVNAANDTNQEVDRDAIQKEVDHLVDQFDTIAYNTQFNKIVLLTGEFADPDDDAAHVSDSEITTGLLAGTYKSDYVNKSYEIGGTTYSADDINAMLASLSNVALSVEFNKYINSAGPYEFDKANAAKKSVDNALELANQLSVENNCKALLTDAQTYLSATPPNKAGAQTKIAQALSATVNGQMKNILNTTLSLNQASTWGDPGDVQNFVNSSITDSTNSANSLTGAITNLSNPPSMADVVSSYKDIMSALAAADRAAGVTPGLHIQVGGNSGQGMVINIANATAAGMRLLGAKVGSYSEANQVIKVCDFAIERLSRNRSKLGAYQNRLEFTVSNNDNQSENLQISESRKRDVDMADEMVNYSKNNILVQAEQSMIAQANSSVEGVLQLLQA